MNDADKILSAIKELQEGQKAIRETMATKKDGNRIDTRLDTLGKGQRMLSQERAQNTTIVEAIREGQESSTAAIRADIQDLATKIAKKKKETDTRLDALEEYLRLD